MNIVRLFVIIAVFVSVKTVYPHVKETTLFCNQEYTSSEAQAVISPLMSFAQELKKMGLSQEEILQQCRNIIVKEQTKQESPTLSSEKTKKVLLYGTITTITIATIAALYYWHTTSKNTPSHGHAHDPACVFCQIARHEGPAVIIDETDELIVIEKVPVRRPVDCLIIPKQHIENIKTLEAANPYDQVILAQMAFKAQELSQRLNGQGDFTVVMNNGRQSNQTVNHMHMHFRSPDNWA